MRMVAVVIISVICLYFLPLVEQSLKGIDNGDTDLAAKCEKTVPLEWGETVTGVKTKLATRENVIALTFDACGTSELSKGYDRELIDYLVTNQISATLFISGLWIEANPLVVRELAVQPLFAIENHGSKHKPASVSGKQAYGISGTASVSELIKEIRDNADTIRKVTGITPRYYRSGTNYYDEVAVKLANDLGCKVVGYNVLGDAGATFNRAKVRAVLEQAVPGSIVLLHMNHPESETAEGVIDAIPLLQQKGYRFVKLSDMILE